MCCASPSSGQDVVVVIRVDRPRMPWLLPYCFGVSELLVSADRKELSEDLSPREIHLQQSVVCSFTASFHVRVIVAELPEGLLCVQLAAFAEKDAEGRRQLSLGCTKMLSDPVCGFIILSRRAEMGGAGDDRHVGIFFLDVRVKVKFV